MPNYWAGVDRGGRNGSNRRRMSSLSTASPVDVRHALAAWGLESAQIATLGHGLINLTWRVDTENGRRFVLQRVNPVFPPAINRDIDLVTRRLADAGLLAPRLQPTTQGRLWAELDGETWRLLSFIEGASCGSVESPGQAMQAGVLLARFHRALDGFDHRFANPRLGVHDTARHLMHLRRALQEHDNHPRYRDVEPLARRILDQADRLEPIRSTPDRVVHGDPKIDNMLFDRTTGTGLALVDLDTVGMMPLPLELGDAFRSWCNPAGEDNRRGEFSAELFAAGLEGYASVAGEWLTADEQAGLVSAVRTIIVELAARFCADALYEDYFGWDSARFASRSEHNQVRAAGQLALVMSLQARQPELEQIVRRVFPAS